MAIEGELSVTEGVMRKIPEEQYKILLQMRDGAGCNGDISTLELYGYVRNGVITEKGRLALQMNEADIVKSNGSRTKIITTI